VPARQLWREIAEAAWECADPGLQFDSTINRWHTAAATGRINGSNPCSEYVHLDNSACNLASINLLKFLADDDHFDVEGFRHTVEVVFTAQEILVGRADYPTEKIAETTRAFRQLGKSLIRAFERQTNRRWLKRRYGEHFPVDFEQQVVAPLNLLGGVGQ